MTTGNIANPGAKLGQAIGERMEQAIDNRLRVLSENLACHYISSGAQVDGGKRKQVHLYDENGTRYQVDAVIADADLRPLVVLESKYIRYKKHNRDKGAWICSTSESVRRNYASIRKFVAVLAGNWSAPSLAMMTSRDIEIFVIGFDRICRLLRRRRIRFDWDEAARDEAIHAYMTYAELSSRQKNKIGEEMVRDVLPPLERTIESVLLPEKASRIEKSTVELYSDLGEIRRFHFDQVEEAVSFLTTADASIFAADNAKRLTDKPPPEETPQAA